MSEQDLVCMPHPITQTTAEVLWDDPLRHGGIYTVPTSVMTGRLEFDGVVFMVVRDEDTPADRRQRLRARLPVVRRWWWR